MIYRIFGFLAIFSMVFLATSCNKDEDENPSEMNIVQLASGNNDLSSLVAAVTRADLVETLSGTGPFTVFAPTNAAFATFLSSAGFNSVDEVPVDVLRNILLNHVVGGTVRSTDLTTGYVNTAATFQSSDFNLSLYVETDGGVRLNGISNVTTADITASNGVVHVVDAVIGLPTITDFAASNPSFSILVQALTRSDLSANFATVLDGTGPFTVFAPTNDAFAALLVELGASSLADVPAALLEAVLLYHVVGDANIQSSMLSNNQQVPTLNGQAFTINLNGGPSITDSRNRQANIVATNVQAANGVVHVLDRVILPE